jgi:hypothetical protein
MFVVRLGAGECGFNVSYCPTEREAFGVVNVLTPYLSPAVDAIFITYVDDDKVCEIYSYRVGDPTTIS